jgi:hypothetical protein
MKRQRPNRSGSTIATALNAFALVSVARMIGPRRIARVAALATEGYLTRLVTAVPAGELSAAGGRTALDEIQQQGHPA